VVLDRVSRSPASASQGPDLLGWCRPREGRPVPASSRSPLLPSGGRGCALFATT